MNKTIIYFLRHGEVENPQKILYGRLPRFSLSQKGRFQIQKVGEFFKKKGISALYTSPLLRARETGAILGDVLKLKPKISSLLNEVRIIFEGMSLDIFHRKIQPHLYSEKYLRKGQESIDAIASRMLKFLQRIIKKHQGEKILVVSHGDPILILKAKISHAKFTWQYKKENYLPTGNWLTLIYENGKFIWLKENY